MRRIEYSKLLLAGLSVAVLGVTVYSMWAMVWLADLTALCYLIPAWFAEFATATAAYYNKAKAENVIKISQTHTTYEGPATASARNEEDMI